MLVTGMFTFLPLSMLWAQTQISDEAGLKAIANNLAGSYILTQDITITGDWTPIGTDDAPFTGTIDGNGKTIKNLRINQSSSDRVGFIGLASGATIKNLGIENANVIGQNDVGAIAGRVMSSTVEKCWVTGYVEGNDHVGAVIGGSEGDSQSTLTNCYAYAYANTRSSQVGGIIGTVKNINISNCYFAGKVVSPGSNSGGIASLIDCDGNNSIESCISMAQNIEGGTVYRILANTGGRSVTLSYNYAYANSLVNGNTVSTSDSDYGASGLHGENATLDQLKTASNYGVLLWDFDNVWKIENGGFPVFKNQTLPLNLDMIVNCTGSTTVASGKTVQLSAASIIPGRTVLYKSSDENIATVDAQGLVTTKAPGNVTITAYTQADGFSNGAEATCAIKTVEVSSNITTAAQLNAMRYELGGSYQLMNDIDLAGTDYENWEPIQGFTGTFDGNGHVIKNMKINTNSNSVGFFGSVDGATIKNVGIEGANVVGGTPNDNGCDVGVLIGQAYQLTLENCYVSDSYVEGRDHVGLMVASTARRDGVTSVIKNCYSTGRLKNYVSQGGGIIGLAEATTIENCYFSGTIDGAGNVACIAALAEAGDVLIKNCVGLSPYVSGNSTSRVLCVKGDNATLTTENNYGRTGMQEIEGTDVYYSESSNATDYCGADMKFSSSKDQSFYETTLGWDFTNTWKMMPKDNANDSGIYPVLKWQTGKISAHLLGVPASVTRLMLNSTLPYNVYGSHGQTVIFGSENENALKPDVSGYTGLAAGKVKALVSSAATSYMNAANDTFTVLVYDPNYVNIIYTPADFDNIRNDLAANYRLANDIDLSSFDNFEPIGTNCDTPFTGKLYGNGYKIENLKINRPDDNNQALFGYTNNAYIDQLTLDKVNVIGSSDVGGLIGKGVGTTINKVCVTGYIEGNDHVGGIGGGTDGGTYSYIQDSYVNANVKTRCSQAGGILGVAQSVHVDRCYFAGTITAMSDQDRYNAGGLIALSENDNVNLNACVSLPTSITGGTCSEFVARGNALESMQNCYTRSDVVMSPYASDDKGLGQATDSQKKIVSTFQNSAIYKSIGWDFDNVWQITDGNYPTLKFVVTGLKGATETAKTNVYSSNGCIYVSVGKPVNIKIYSLTGALVYQSNVSDSQNGISLPKGCYIVKAGETVTKVLN